MRCICVSNSRGDDTRWKKAGWRRILFFRHPYVWYKMISTTVRGTVRLLCCDWERIWLEFISVSRLENFEKQTEPVLTCLLNEGSVLSWQVSQHFPACPLFIKFEKKWELAYSFFNFTLTKFGDAGRLLDRMDNHLGAYGRPMPADTDQGFTLCLRKTTLTGGLINWIHVEIGWIHVEIGLLNVQ